MIDLDEDDLRQMCTESSFDKGERYFEEGRVRITEAMPSRIKAVVSGTKDYLVEIKPGDETSGHDYSGECDSPYDWGGLSKHIVAALLAIIRDDEDIEPLMEKSNSEWEEVKFLLKLADVDALRSFLLSEMERRADLGIGSKPSSAKKAREEAWLIIRLRQNRSTMMSRITVMFLTERT